MTTDRPETTANRPSGVRPFRRGERGAVLVQTAIAMIGLLAFNGLVVDYGILWLARRQAQNAADAGAMAGAISLAFFNFDDKDTARLSAVNAAKQNFVWGEAPGLTGADVFLPPTEICPPGSPGEGEDACVRVNVYRNQEFGNPIPTIFGTLFGVSEQGVKATATAQVIAARGTECLRPWAIIDRWDEAPADTPHSADTDWNMLEIFEQPADVYVPPMGGTGFHMPEDYGLRFIINDVGGGNPPSISPGWFRLIDIPRKDESNVGADTLKKNIMGCGGFETNYALPSGEECPDEMTSMGNEELAEWAKKGCYRVQTGAIGAQKNVVQDLIDLDEFAKWDGDEDGEIVDSIYPPGESKRIVPIGVFDISRYMTDDPTGSHGVVRLVNIFGFFIEGMGDVANDGTITLDDHGGKSVIGRIVSTPGMTPDTSGGVAPEDAFLLTILLVR